MDNLVPHTEVTRVEFENLLKGLGNLSEEQKSELFGELSKYKAPVTIILGGNNVVNNSFAIQANGEAEKVAEQLKDLPPELIATIAEAIAIWVKNQKSPS